MVARQTHIDTSIADYGGLPVIVCVCKWWVPDLHDNINGIVPVIGKSFMSAYTPVRYAWCWLSQKQDWTTFCSIMTWTSTNFFHLSLIRDQNFLQKRCNSPLQVHCQLLTTNTFYDSSQNMCLRNLTWWWYPMFEPNFRYMVSCSLICIYCRQFVIFIMQWWPRLSLLKIVLWISPVCS